MQLIGVFLLALKLALLLLSVVAPVVAIGGFALLGGRAGRLRRARARLALRGLAVAGMTAAIAWMIGTDAPGFLATIGTWP